MVLSSDIRVAMNLIIASLLQNSVKIPVLVAFLVIRRRPRNSESYHNLFRHVKLLMLFGPEKLPESVRDPLETLSFDA
jgi:hypothetical protein